MNYQLSKGDFFPVFILTRSHGDLPPFVPPGHHLHPGCDQQEVPEYSDQPSLPGSPADLHQLRLQQEENLWRPKNFILSQAELGQHAPQRSGSAWNPHFLDDSS